MNSIKFRVWSKHLNKMFLGDEIDLHYCGDVYDKLNRLFQNDAVVFQQFIGKKDKNNKEIYEGDIIKYAFKMDQHGDLEYGQGEVYYDEEGAAWLFDRSYEWSFIDGPIIDSSIEVIGNIFETKK